MSQNKDNNEAARAPDLAINPCGGCGERDPEKRCIGCGHIFLMRVNHGASQSSAAYYEEQPDGTITPVDPSDMTASASQSSTAGAAKRGNTSDEFTDKLRRLVGSSHQNFDEILAHVARQRQESAADTAAVDAAVLPPLPTKHYEFTSTKTGWFTAKQMQDYATTYGAQQREAGRRDRLDLSSLPRFDMVPGECGRMTIGVEDGGTYLSFYDVERALSAAPPAKAEGLTTTCFVCAGSGKRERHASGGHYQCGQCNGSGKLQVILAQQAKGASNA